jgi:hypothetical protein
MKEITRAAPTSQSCHTPEPSLVIDWSWHGLLFDIVTLAIRVEDPKEDDLSNMQWQTTADAKAKDKVE